MFCDTGYNSSVWTNPPTPSPDHVLTCDQPIQDIFLDNADIEKSFALIVLIRIVSK